MYLSRLLYLSVLILLLISCTEEQESTYSLNITSTPEEGGTVSNLSGEYEEGTIVEITASANENWVFTGWQGDLSVSTPKAEILMDTDKDIAAVFEKRTYPLVVEIVGGGVVNEEIIRQKTNEFPHGTVIELTAKPDEGWQFDRWEGDLTGTANPQQLTIENETMVTAVFEPVTFNLTVETEGAGSVHQELEKFKTTKYSEGDRVTLTAEAEEGWRFTDWQGDLDGSDNPAVITMNSNKFVTAVFQRFYSLQTSVEPTEGGRISPDGGEFIRDSEVEVEAIPAGSGWEFDRWEGDFSGSLNPISLTMNGNKTLVAFFKKKEFIVDIETEGEGSVERVLLSGNETSEGYLFGSEVELTAHPLDGWYFAGWEGDIKSEENPIIIEIDNNYLIKAVFEPESQEEDEEGEDEESDEETGL